MFLVLGAAVAVALSAALGAAMAASGQVPSVSLAGPRLLLVQTALLLLAFGFATWLIGRRAARLTWEELRWKPLDQAGRGWLVGLGLGLAAAAVAVLLSLPFGGARFLPDEGSLGDYLRQALLTICILAPAALGEEIVFRGVAQVLLARALGRWRAIALLSVLFGFAHLFNPNHTPLAIANIMLAGIFLGAVFYLPGGIWTAWGAHLGWNATLALLDAPVSGLPFTIPLIDYDPGGPAWLTGGSFGPEGGALASGAIIVATGAAWRWTRKETA